MNGTLVDKEGVSLQNPSLGESQNFSPTKLVGDPTQNAIKEVAEENIVSHRNTCLPGEIPNPVSIFAGRKQCIHCNGNSGYDSDFEMDFETDHPRIQSGVTDGEAPVKDIANDLMNHLSRIKIEQKFSLRQLQESMSFVSEFDTLDLAKTHGLANYGLGPEGLTNFGVLNHTSCTLEEKFNYFDE